MTSSLSLTARVIGATSSLLVLLATGCSMSPSSGTSGFAMPALQGQVHGGQQGVVGSTITAYATGNAGYGSASRQLATTTSGANGSFSLSAASQCQTGDNVYIVATGGDPGGTGANNSALAMMVGLGPCSGISNATKVSMNELTTVASVWALAPFMADSAHVGTSATNPVGLANAFASITGKLVNTATGVVPSASLPTTVTLPTSEINTLADILAACINTVDGTAPAAHSGTCQTILAATAVNGVTPANTLQAALNLAAHPTLGLTLTSQVVPNAPYQPTLTAAPTSWTIAIQHAAPDTTANTPAAIAVDAYGDIYTVGSATGTNSVVVITPGSGSATENHSTLLTTPSAVAVDSAGYLWITDRTANDVVKILPTSPTNPPATYSGGSISAPNAIAFDAAGNAWISNHGNNSVTELTSTGTVVGNFTNGVAAPVAIAVSPY